MKPIVLTDEIKQSLIDEFSAQIDGGKMFDGEFTFKKTFKWDGGGEKAVITFTPEAYAKMLALVNSFSSEVGWYGLTYRDGDGPNFLIKDILIFPQFVTGADVDTDQEEFTKWLYSQPDEVFNHIRMHGHSHVNFSTSPSATDLDDQKAILSQLRQDGFYIFIIWNKKMEHTIKIFDLRENTLYEDKDIVLKIGESDLNGFVTEAKKLVTYQSYTSSPKTTAVTGTTSPGAGTSSGKASKSGGKSKRKKDSKSEINSYAGLVNDFDDDYDSPYPYPAYAGYFGYQRY